MERHTILETNLKQLKLRTYKQNYRPFAEDAIRGHKGYAALLLALTEQELTQRLQREARKNKQ